LSGLGSLPGGARPAGSRGPLRQRLRGPGPGPAAGRGGGGRVILRAPEVDPAELATRTGWEVKPEGACKADRCVPLPGVASGPDGRLDAGALARRLGMSLVEDRDRDLWALG